MARLFNCFLANTNLRPAKIQAFKGITKRALFALFENECVRLDDAGNGKMNVVAEITQVRCYIGGQWMSFVKGDVLAVVTPTGAWEEGCTTIDTSNDS